MWELLSNLLLLEYLNKRREVIITYIFVWTNMQYKHCYVFTWLCIYLITFLLLIVLNFVLFWLAHLGSHLFFVFLMTSEVKLLSLVSGLESRHMIRWLIKFPCVLCNNRSIRVSESILLWLAYSCTMTNEGIKTPDAMLLGENLSEDSRKAGHVFIYEMLKL